MILRSNTLLDSALHGTVHQIFVIQKLYLLCFCKKLSYDVCGFTWFSTVFKLSGLAKPKVWNAAWRYGRVVLWSRSSKAKLGKAPASSAGAGGAAASPSLGQTAKT